MNHALRYLEYIIDLRQQKKVRHRMKYIITIVFFAQLSNANKWMEIYYDFIELTLTLYRYLRGITEIEFLPKICHSDLFKKKVHDSVTVKRHKLPKPSL